MKDQNDKNSQQNKWAPDEETNSKKKQQQTDPQITELKGFIDPNEKLEPEIEEEVKDAKNEKPKI